MMVVFRFRELRVSLVQTSTHDRDEMLTEWRTVPTTEPTDIDVGNSARVHLRTTA